LVIGANAVQNNACLVSSPNDRPVGNYLNSLARTNFSPNNVNIKEASSLFRQAYRVSDIMTELDCSSIHTINRPLSLQNSNRAISAYLEIRTSDSYSSHIGLRLSNLESTFIGKVNSSISSIAYKLGTDASKITSLNENVAINSAFSYSIEQNLSVAKQTRWIARNLPISEYLSNSNFTYSQAKALVGNQMFKSSMSSKNVWASSKVNDLPLSLLPLSNDFLSNHADTNRSLINHFEESRSFISKKSYLTLQSGANSTSVSNVCGHLNELALETSVTQDIYSFLISDMNTLFLSSTLSSGIGESLYLTGSNSTKHTNLFLTNEYLSYFVASHDSFVISLNTTNPSVESNFHFFTPAKFLQPLHRTIL